MLPLFEPWGVNAVPLSASPSPTALSGKVRGVGLGGVKYTLCPTPHLRFHLRKTMTKYYHYWLAGLKEGLTQELVWIIGIVMWGLILSPFVWLIVFMYKWVNY